MRPWCCSRTATPARRFSSVTSWLRSVIVGVCSRPICEEGFRDEFVGELPDHLVERVSPDLWTLHWRLMETPPRPEIVLGIFEDQATTLADFPRMQAYLREHRPPALIVWGPHDGYMPERSAVAYLRDLPDAELHMFDGGHWALETNLDEIVTLSREFLGRVHGRVDP
jgi:pimeloyl-ACP methyl ester carboxylesterase